MKPSYPILTALISALLWQAPANAETAGPSPTERMRSVLSGSATSTIQDGKIVPKPEELRGIEAGEFDAPSISEIFGNARKNNITGDWHKFIQTSAQDYGALPLPKRSFVVGKSLADIAFLVLDMEPGKAPSMPLVQQAYDAVMSLDPPQNIKEEAQKLRQRAQTDLKGDELREEISRLLDEQIPLIERAEAAQTRDSGVVMALSGYLRALYLGARVLADMEKPTPAQLEMMKALKDTMSHYQDYLKTHLSEEFKNATEVEDLAATLYTIVPVLQKDTLTQDDAKSVTQTLSLLFD
jgi:hypothetical protein